MNADVRELDNEELSFADKSDFVVALVCSHVLAATAGWILHEQYIAKKLAETPVVVVQRIQPQPAALTQWDCSAQGISRAPRSVQAPRDERLRQTQGVDHRERHDIAPARGAARCSVGGSAAVSTNIENDGSP
jgi:hypothetical protein